MADPPKKYIGTTRLQWRKPVIDDPADERRALLEHSALRWAVAVKSAAHRLSATELTKQILTVAKGERAAEEWGLDAHLLTLGIRHIERHLRYLENAGFRTPEILRAAAQFIAVYTSTDVKDFRDLLEHQAEYIMGKGQKQHLVVELRQPVSFGSDSTSGEELVSVYVFGRECRVDPIVRAVADLEAALRAGAPPLQEDALPISITLPFPAHPVIQGFTKEHARLLLEWLLAHPDNSDVAYTTTVNLLRQALEQSSGDDPGTSRETA